MKNVLIRLQEYAARATHTEKEVVEFFLREPERAALCSIYEVAEKTFSSPSTVMRLCKKTGFRGYKEFQQALLYELAVRKDSMMEQMEEIRREDSLEEIVNKVTYKNIASLENTRKLLDMDVLKQCVNLLVGCNTIYLFGLGSSLLVARDAHLKFLRVNKQCFVCDDWHAQYLQAMNIQKGSIALIISYSGMTREMVMCAKEIKNRGVPIILISRFDDSPLAKIADYNLPVATTEFIVRSGAMSSRIAQLNIIDILYTAYINANYEENIMQLERTHIRKQDSQ